MLKPKLNQIFKTLLIFKFFFVLIEINAQNYPELQSNNSYYAIQIGIFRPNQFNTYYSLIKKWVLDYGIDVRIAKINKNKYALQLSNIENCQQINEQLLLLSKDGVNIKNTRIFSYNCNDQLTKDKNKSVCLSLNIDKTSSIKVSSIRIDSVSYAAFAIFHSDSVKYNTWSYLRNEFPKEKILILVEPHSNTQSVIYRVFIGLNSKLEDTENIRQKLKYDGYKPAVKEPHTPIFTFQCGVKQCGLK